MDQELARIYGTPGALSDEDLEKVAEADLFAKLASESGVDLNQYSDEQIAELYATVFPKYAQEEEEEGEEEESEEEKKKREAAEKEKAKEKEAAAEFAEQKEWQEKVTQMDKLGRVMAHAYVQELGLIGQQLEKQAADEQSSEAPKEEEGDASAIDELAAEKAVEKASEAGFDPEQAAQRVAAVFTLGGPGPSEKIASAQTLDAAVDVRALEILEKAGYQVEWK